MKCAKVIALFSRYIEDDIDDSTRNKIDQHFKVCADCQREFAVFSNALEIIHSATKVKPQK